MSLGQGHALKESTHPSFSQPSRAPNPRLRITTTACLQCTAANLMNTTPDSRRQYLQLSNLLLRPANRTGCHPAPKLRSTPAATHSPGKELVPTEPEQPKSPEPDAVPEANGVKTPAQAQAQEESSTASSSQPEDDSAPVKVALAMLRLYKTGISPLMPSSCRFLPTCSEYSMSSYRKFGVWRGTVLTAWRLLRCNPWGGRGYDPPAWPPKGLEAVYEQSEYAPQVTVLLGGSFLVYLITGLVSELTS